VRFNLDSRSGETSKAMIASRVADCGFLKMPIDADDLDAAPLFTSDSVCVLRGDHPLAARGSLDPEALRGEPLILLGAGLRWRAQVDEAFAEFDLRPTLAIETHTHGTACALAERGVGIALVNRRLAAKYLSAPLVARRFVPDILHEYAFVTPARSKPSRLTAEFGRIARAYFAESESQNSD
jgi:DNA-binding transcriptional LysR family regulator